MASSNRVFVSPGVYTSERDLTFVAQSIGVTTLGIVGETLSGPAFEPVFIRNFDEFQQYFGPTSPTKFVNTQIPKYEAAYIAKSYLQQSNQLFVTRVLGLSGYDAGPSWSVKTIGNVDGSTVGVNANEGVFTINFSGSQGNPDSVAFTSAFSGPASSNIAAVSANTITLTNGSSSTISEQMLALAYDVVSDASKVDTLSYMFGTVSDTVYDTVTGDGATSFTNVFGVDGLKDSDADYSDVFNYNWYNGLFEVSGTSYEGVSFTLVVDSISGPTNALTGTLKGYVTSFTGDVISDYHELIVATLRSRGIAEYLNNENPVFEITGTSDVVLVDTDGSLDSNPFSNFNVSGVTRDGNTFSFETSLQSRNSNFLSKVFGRSNFAKDRNEVPLFLEEEYSVMLTNLYNEGKIRGISTDLVALDSAQSAEPDSIGFYLERYQTPLTPFVVSELRGNEVERLFRFISISDGNSANREVKISIANMSFTNNNFDVLVRDFYDTDESPVVLERYANCTMNSSSPSYIAKKIGTSNGDFELKSRFIMVELSEDHPEDALPCGFEGYVTRQYADNKSPQLTFKTEYNTAGQVILTPPGNIPVLSVGGGATSVRSSGDKVRRVYLGLSDTKGYDADFFNYKGKSLPANIAEDTEGVDWTYLTQGFHMDSGATVVTISDEYVTSGQTAFQVGTAEFRSEPTSSDSPYYRQYARKFTLLPYGGFDGWDIYRESRTNSDSFKLGGTQYQLGASPTVQFPSATGWGAFKKITEGEDTNWANTDYYAYLKGIHTFANPSSLDINVFVTPGIDYVNNLGLVEDSIDMIENERADSIYITTTPDWEMFTPTTSVPEEFIYPSDAVLNLEDSELDSNYTATYYPWIQIKDNPNNTNVFIPPTSEVVRNLALTDNIAFPWFASAGYTRGLVNAVKARKKLTQEYRDTLYQGRINPIATFSDVGPVIFGNKTLQVRESALDRINVRRLLLQARKLISAVAVRLLFEQNDDQVRQDFLDAVNPILDSIRRDRGLTDFRVTVSNDPEDLDRNQLSGKIYIKPTRSLEFIDIEFVITPTGASFEDV